LIRDADSRLSLRDRWAAEDWLADAARAPFHVVRDHPSHANYPLMGGTWGARAAAFRGPLPPLAEILGGFYAARPGAAYGSDIDFLSTSLWGDMKRLGVVQHDSHSCGAPNHGLAGRPFPRPRAGVEHVGAVYVYEGGAETVRDVDLRLLRDSRGAPDCLPPPAPGAARAAPARAAARAAAAAAAPGAPFAAAARGGARAATAWREGAGEAAGACAARGAGGAVVLHWPDAFVDGVTAAGASAVFTYADALPLGARYAPRQYDERVPPRDEPIQALDGGVRYAPAWAVVAAAYAGGAGAPPPPGAAAALAAADAPRLLLALAPPDALLLLPPAWAAPVVEALRAAPDARVAALADRVVEHEAGERALYYAASVFVLDCTGEGGE